MDLCNGPHALALSTFFQPADPTKQRLGGDFVDLSLKLIMRGAAGRMWMFDPRYHHGTTTAVNLRQATIAVTWSVAIKKAWENLTAFEKGEFSWGYTEHDM